MIDTRYVGITIDLQLSLFHFPTRDASSAGSHAAVPGPLASTDSVFRELRGSEGAYGERRDVDWDGPVSSTHLTTAANTTRHGFTDHEHLDSVKLIHMGGRVYDRKRPAKDVLMFRS
jgi:hypothetical protein